MFLFEREENTLVLVNKMGIWRLINVLLLEGVTELV